MAKSAQAFRTIREVADWLDVAAHVLRFWESKFNQIKPVKRAGGRRYYRPADMALVGGIKVLLHDRGLTIRGVQKMISEEGVDAVSALSPSVDAFLGNEEVAQGEPGDVWEADALADGTEIEGTLAESSAEAPDDGATDSDPVPRPLLPASDTAEGTLGRLAAFATLPAEDRAFFAPQIEALARLRDRIATPPPSP